MSASFSLPGPTAALGRLKFDFDNPFAVYLHDTPLRGRFDSFDRLDSHGCVRLQKPVELAELMFKGDPEMAGQVQTKIATGKTQRVALPERVAVYLLYWTAFANANGTLGFRDDPYKWDKLLAGKIAASSKRAEQATSRRVERGWVDEEVSDCHRRHTGRCRVQA